MPDWRIAFWKATAFQPLMRCLCCALPDEELLDLLAAAYKIRRRYFGNTVQLYFLMNAKSGLCPEDCSYCSQSKTSTADIPRYNLLQRDKLLDGCGVAYERGSSTYCIVISARGPNEREIQAVEQIVPEIKSQYGLQVCACLGLLTSEQARRLAACGVDQVNHNLNTSAEHYHEICSTHTFQDRLDTLQAVREAGMKICSGGILGMGQTDQDVVSMALELREIRAEMIPVNFLNPIDGTPLAGKNDLNPRQCLKALAMFRFTNPDVRNPDRRRPRTASRLDAMPRFVRRELHVRRRLPHDQGTTSRGRLPHDRRNGIRHRAAGR